VPPLPRIRSLAYFQPVVEELQENPVPDGYLQYLRFKLRSSLQRMGVETQRVVNVGGFTEGQRRFLDFHRDKVLLRAVR
jgi:hypothetical protein